MAKLLDYITCHIIIYFFNLRVHSPEPPTKDEESRIDGLLSGTKNNGK
jgi:hypothetical protein